MLGIALSKPIRQGKDNEERESKERDTKKARAEKGKEPVQYDEDGNEISPFKIQPVGEVLTVELFPGDPTRTTRIGAHLSEDTSRPLVDFLRRNVDVFSWTPTDLVGVDPEVMIHKLNVDPAIRPVKQKKWDFGPEKDKIVQQEVEKLLEAKHIREIQFSEWLSNVVLVPKGGDKWRTCVDFRDLNKACPKDSYPIPRIDQLVASTSGCELLSMMDASQGYHQIRLDPEDKKKS